MEAHLLGRGPRRDRGGHARHPGGGRLGSHRLGPGAALHRGHHGRGPSASRRAAGLHQSRHEQRDRRRPSRRCRDLRQDLLRALRRRLLLLGPDPDLGQQSALHPDPERPLPDGGALQGRAAGLHRPGLQRLVDLLGPLRARGAGLRRGAGPGHRPRAGRGGPRRPGLRGGADGSAAAGARGHAALPAQLGPRGGRQRRGALPARRAAGGGGGAQAEPGPRGPAPQPRGPLRGDARGRQAGRGAHRLLAAAGAARGLHARAGVEALRHAGLADPRAGAAAGPGQVGLHGDLEQHGQVLPRQPDGAHPGPRLRAHRQLRQEGQRLRRLPVAGPRRPRALHPQHVLALGHDEHDRAEDHRRDDARQGPLEAGGLLRRDDSHRGGP